MSKLFKFLARFGFDGFILALMGMILLAYLWPHGGTGDGPYSLSTLAGYGISLIFFFYGLKLDRNKLREGLSNWRLHILVQCSTFILFPLLVFPFKDLLTGEQLQLLWLGAFFLASLPSTVSSSVVMVSIAEGNIPAAIFNASVSSILGIFITPLWMGMVTTTTAGELDLGDIFIKLLLQILLPVVLGIALNKKWGAWADAYKKQLKYFDQTIILIIVYTAFCDSFEKKMFSGYGFSTLLLLGMAVLVLFFFVYLLIGVVCKLLKFNREDRITAEFCGSKKSLVHGTVMLKVLFANSTITGILLLPLMLYHALQLIIISMLARRMAKQQNAATPGGNAI